MAQCHAERRKHPGAMDFYVGSLHNKLHHSSRVVNKYSHWPADSYKNVTSLNTGYSSSSPSRCHEQRRPSACSGSFRENTAASANPSSDVKPLDNVSHGSALDAGPHQKIVDRNFLNLKSGISAAKEKKPIPTKASSVMNLKVEKSDSFDCARGTACNPAFPPATEMKQPNADPALLPGIVTSVSPAGVQASEKGGVDCLNGKNGFTKKMACNDPVNSVPRIYKSAELGVSFTKKGGSRTGCSDAGSRLYKSGEQIVLRGTSSNVGKLKECLNGGLIVGSQRQVALGPGDSFSSTGGSPTTLQEGERRLSGGSNGSANPSTPVGGDPPVKDGRRASSGSDGGSPMTNEVLKRSPLCGHSTADLSLSGNSNLVVKDAGRLSSSGNAADTKDAIRLKGMGNILAGSVKLSYSKPNCKDSKIADNPLQSPEDLVTLSSNASGRGYLTSNAAADGALNRSLGNLCTKNWSNRTSSSCGMATKSRSKTKDDIRNGCEPTDPEGLKNAGNEQYRMGHFLEAVALYDKAIGICPTHAPYRSNRAAALTGLGRLGEAVLECEEAIKLNPQYSRAHQRAGHIYLRLGLIDSARRHLQAAGLQDDTQDALSLQKIQRHITRCIEGRKVGDWRIVLEESNAAVVAGADSAPQVLGYKSEALLKLHRLQEAEGFCESAQRQERTLHALGIAPADTFLYMLQARIEMSFGRFENAVSAAEAAVNIDPRNLEAVGLLKKARAVDHTRTLGNELFKAGRLFEACAVYSEGLESDRINAVLLCNRAACRSKLGQWEKAIEDCDAALSAQPHYLKALMRRAQCSTKLERWEDALRDYEDLRAQMPNDMEVAQSYFDVQAALNKSRGEEIHKMKLEGKVEEVLNEGQFKEVTNLPGLAVVQFISRWSNRCCQISLFMDELRRRFPCVHFVKVDVEDNPCIAKTESVTFIPTFKIYKSGQKVKELQGPSEQALEYAVKHYSL